VVGDRYRTSPPLAGSFEAMLAVVDALAASLQAGEPPADGRCEAERGLCERARASSVR